jgi:cell division protein DivIC
LKKVPAIFKNFYFLASLSFIIWIAFLDGNDLISQIKLKSKLQSLEKEKIHYALQIEQVKKEREALFNNPILLEKFARERYFMKKPTEDIFVIEED